MTNSQDLGFSYRATKDGKVFIAHHGRQVTILKDSDAQDFLAEVTGASMDAQQQAMARATGNYKRGNESLAKNHPRNR
jgi:L-2-hydroxyglutarate oxidase LhgO